MDIAPDSNAARETRDVMAFGSEIGRVLSDGRIVGRAEPFAKVFPGSRMVKRAVGVAAWAVLEDIALDARIDDRGRLVAETNVRRIAENIGLNKETVSRHLAALREFGFVLQEEERDSVSGRYRSYRYVIDPAACIERFTHTPSARTERAHNGSGETAPRGPRPENPDTVQPRPETPGPATPDTGATGHGESGHQRQEKPATGEQQHAGPDAEDLQRRLERLGVARGVAAELVECHPHRRVADALQAAASGGVRNPAAWVVQALRAGWDFQTRLAGARSEAVRRRRDAGDAEAVQAAEQADRRERERAEGWACALSSGLDDAALTKALAEVTRPLPGLRRASPPLARSQLLTWAIDVHRRAPARPLAEALCADLAAGPRPAAPLDGPLPEPPAVPEPAAADLTTRIAARLGGSTAQQTTAP